jgi:hypothetical protein
MDFGCVKNVIKAVSFVGPVTVCSDHNVEPQVFGSGVYLETGIKFYFFFVYFLLSERIQAVFPSIVGNPRVALLQPPEEPVQPAVPVASSRPAKRKKTFIDLMETEKKKRKKDLKAVSNRKQSEKRKRERERVKEENTSLTPRKKEELVRGVLEREKEWALLDLYDDDDNNNWSGGKKKRD